MGLAKSSTKQATSHVGDLLDRIAEAHKAGKRKKALYETQRYLQSFDARYLACVAAYKGLRPPRRPPIHQLPAIAKKLNTWASSTEPVTLYLKEKEPLPFEVDPTYGTNLARCLATAPVRLSFSLLSS